MQDESNSYAQAEIGRVMCPGNDANQLFCLINKLWMRFLWIDAARSFTVENKSLFHLIRAELQHIYEKFVISLGFSV